MNDWSDEETDDPLNADRRNFYKVEKWSRDGHRVGLVLVHKMRFRRDMADRLGFTKPHSSRASLREHSFRWDRHAHKPRPGVEGTPRRSGDRQFCLLNGRDARRHVIEAGEHQRTDRLRCIRYSQ
jgi:hypothetical protein